MTAEKPIGVAVRLSGPFFSANVRGAAEDAIKNAINEIVLTGEREARLMAQPRPAGVFRSRDYARAHGYFQTGHYNRSIHADMRDSRHGIIFDSNVTYGPWLEGVSSRNDTTRFKGYAIFRKTRDKLDKSANGILNKHLAALARSLS